MKKIPFFVLILVLISSCTMPETKIYSIHISDNIVNSAANESSTEGPSVVVSINAPRYLTQPYIAFRKSPYELEISRYSKWESPPDDIVKDEFRTYLSSTGIFKEVRASSVIPEGFYAFEINLKKFERYDEANDSYGFLVFDIKMYSPDSEELYRADVSRKIKLEDKTFLCLAKGLSNALSESIKEVSGALTDVVKE
jgi:ABC-type uncharacterized transport system auxiliary subunit